MRIRQASFFWKNDAPDGLGLTLGPPAFSPDELTRMFDEAIVGQYFRDSDTHLGTDLVTTYLTQLAGIANEAKRGAVSIPQVILAALNIMYLADRGFIPTDEFNGPMFVYERS